MNSHSGIREVIVDRETCLHKDSCKTDVCTPADCSRYKTKISCCMEEMDEGYKWFYTCDVSGKTVGPFSRNEVDPSTIAAQLRVRPKAVWYILINDDRISDEKKAELEKIPVQMKISDLKADMIGKGVLVNVQVAGETSQKALPKKLNIYCKKCGFYSVLDFEKLEGSQRTSFLETVVFGDRLTDLANLIQAESCDRGKQHHFSVEPAEFMDFSIIFVRDLLDPLVKFNQRVYQTRKIYLINQVLPYAKKVSLRGTVVLDPRSKDITVIANEAVPYEDQVAGFKITEQDKKNWNRYFTSSKPEDLLTQVAPSLVGRPLVQEGLQLTLHSISEIPNVYGQFIRGSLRGSLYGDTKTNKTTAAKDLTIDHYGLGDYILGEASSRTGITYTIDNDNRALIWGALALNDLGFLVIDGMHSFHREEWRETREALESQRIVVRRSLSGEALARTRVIGIYNPGPNKPMNTYLFKCQGAVDTFCFNDPPDVTRWDFFIPFSRQDVPENDVVRSKPLKRPVPDGVFVRHVFWAWSRRPEHIEYTEGARNTILVETMRLMERYAIDSIPIVHLGYREVITRVAVAYASWLHSTDLNHEKVIVTEQHVQLAVNFLCAVADALELGQFKLEQEGRLKMTGTELSVIISELDEDCLKIIDEIKVEPRTSSYLAEILGVSVPTIKRRYAILSKHQLIQTMPGKGISLSPRGIVLLKQSFGIKVSETDTSKGEKVSENDTLTPAFYITEKIFEVRKWVLANKDADSLIDAIALADRCKQRGIEPQKVIEKLKDEGALFDVPQLGKFGVKVM